MSLTSCSIPRHDRKHDRRWMADTPGEAEVLMSVVLSKIVASANVQNVIFGNLDPVGKFNPTGKSPSDFRK
ncbi:hypothetical protein JQ629_10330 [Bradyrhizobium sp. AUGA SZCCT0222]|uniref:hypothetical protein n=1 Tax=Bradyrhizobium sp. AUGA SZCCT0222 TaxID=2807668 RepID=UPI001BAA6407|nr:hypothetical protein [Bradyrhizobium sp. AUGA SZCCT0222]MBR1267901.1 hypothetical protein [Bradyrhizobium sp. AUGA SZCCT0222]